jgi:hypothetical protein
MDSTFINTKGAIFELLIFVRGPRKKRGLVKSPLFPSSSQAAIFWPGTGDSSFFLKEASS